MKVTREDPVLISGRREALAVLVIWLTAITYTVTYCHFNGYERRLEDLTFVLGFPDWIFWGIVAPWLVCLVVSWGFSYLFMTDAELGAEQDDSVGEQGDPDKEAADARV